ncbi:SGNH/GDSL hydrolase family protein [Rhodococcoides fascians]|uniref:SGNH/GDSL hydrolase family protein n=1 Tax=Rhodococcoides fascians TaxID=1828 RepID=UPI00055C619C|nr:SGNH/GDSL hydrolase family protein [Rhodococcus fascians]
MNSSEDLPKRRTRRRPSVVACVLVSLLVLIVSGIAGWSIGSMYEHLGQGNGPSAGVPDVPTSVPVVAFIGDSYGQGIGASSAGTRWTTLASAALGWSEMNLAVGGTGYTTSYLGQPTDYATKVESVRAAQPDIIVVSGGRNDHLTSGPPEIGMAAAALYGQLRSAAPDAELVVVSPIWEATDIPAEFAAIIDSIRRAAEGASVKYLDIGEPLSGHPDLVVADGLHPNDAGHHKIAEHVVAVVG